MPVTHGAQALPWRGVRHRSFASKACVSLHINSFQAVDDVLSSAAAGLLLSNSKLRCFQAAPSASPPPQLWLWQGQGGAAAAAANRASLRLVSQAFPFGCDAPQNCPSSTGFGVVPHHPSRSPSLLPSSEEVRYGISGSGKRRTAQESKVLQAKLGIWGLRRHDWLCWRSHSCTELVSCLTDLCKS